MAPASTHHPGREELRAARGRPVADVIAPGLRVLFCGINPGLYSGAVGHHFARPGNRFWPVLFRAGFTRRLLDPSEERLLLEDGWGITNIVNRATASADELAPEDLRRGAAALEEKVARFFPANFAVLGIDATEGLAAPARPGRQDETMGRDSHLCHAEPSGLNASYGIGMVDSSRTAPGGRWPSRTGWA
jgi:TDG/mug DNA glycosylase family protein